MGRPPQVEARPGTAVAIATGAPLAPGSDAVLMVEHTQQAAPELVEVLRAVAPGDGMVRADEDAARRPSSLQRGDPARTGPGHAGGRRGHRALGARPPAVTIVSTGDELVPPDTAELDIGQVRDSTAVALAALVAEAALLRAGIVPTIATH